MGKILVIGCGGVASVAIQKCAQNAGVFDEICIASRTVEKCDALKAKLEEKGTKAKIPDVFLSQAIRYSRKN